jgi:hypothetical protein
LKSSARASLQVTLFIAFVGALLVLAWLNRASGTLSPKVGAGYWLGVAGASLMLIVLGYPLRKRLRILRSWGKVAWWFRWHMFLGVLGPTLIVLHSNYSIHSTNALVAFVAMLVVVASGIVGRYLYAHIHRGLYGARIEARDLARDAAALVAEIEREMPLDRQSRSTLQTLEREAMSPSRGLFDAIVRAFRVTSRARSARRALLAALGETAPRIALAKGWTAADLNAHRVHCSDLARSYTASLRRAGTLAVYERLFALWHVLHLPLIVLLAITAIIHIVAVNLY